MKFLFHFSNRLINCAHGQKMAINYININKCPVLSTSSRVPSVPHSYFIHGISVSNRDTSCIDLGVAISHNLAFKDHIYIILSRTRLRISVLFRGFASRDIDILIRAFLVCIRAIVEYNSVVPSPSSVCLTDLMESVRSTHSH
jgi:hypothetical protein